MHAHDHGKGNFYRLLWAVFFTFSFSIIEAFGGYLSHSLTLMGDAGHMSTDALALGIAAFASWIATKPPSKRHSFGYARAEVIAAFLSSMLMLFISIAIMVAAIKRFHAPVGVHGGTVTIIASIGLLINLIIAYVLHKGHQSINVRAALLHVISDILGSIAALISGVIIMVFAWYIIDPMLSILISLLILYSCIKLLNESLAILMQSVPAHIDLKELSDSLQQIDGVEALHDLHVWTMSSGKLILSAHINIAQMSDWPCLLEQLHDCAQNNYGIDHVTLQPEAGNSCCFQSCDKPQQ